MVTRIVAATLGLTLGAATGLAAEPAALVRVEGTAFVVSPPGGRALAQEELVGAVLDVSDERGGPLTVRIDAFAYDPQDPSREIVLYRLRALDGRGEWQELCLPDPAGERWAFPLAGTWSADGRHSASADGLTVTCTSGGVASACASATSRGSA